MTPRRSAARSARMRQTTTTTRATTTIPRRAWRCDCMRRRTEAAGHSEELSTLLGRLPALASSRGRLATINGFLASAVDGRLVLVAGHLRLTIPCQAVV